MVATMGALDFGVNANGTEDTGASRYGRYFWAVGLSDGRQVRVHADRIEVSASGALLVWQDTKVVGRGLDEKREDREAPLLTMTLAPGQWVHAYSASVLDGSPVVVDSLDRPIKPED